MQGFRLSPRQRRLWSLIRADRTWPLRVQALFEVRGELRREDLEAALRRLVAGHEILRTGFRLSGEGEPWQVIAESAKLRVEEVETDSEAGMDDAPEALSARLVRRRAGPDLLLLSISALCGDVRSLRLLAGAALRVVAGERVEEPFQYADVAEAFLQLLESEEASAGRAYWGKRRIEDPIAGRIPGQLAKPAEGPARVEHLRASLAPRIVSGLEELARQEGSEIEDVLAAAWLALLVRLSGAPDLALGVGFHGRTDPSLAEALGPFAGCLPLRVEARDDLPFRGLVHRIAEERAEMARWQDLFSWGEGEEAGFPPFAFDFERADEVAGAGVTLSLSSVLALAERFLLRLSCLWRPGAPVLTFSCDARGLDPDTLGQLSGRFAALLESCLDAPGSAIGDLASLGAAERAQLLRQGLGEPVEDAPACAHRLVSAQAWRTPASPAAEQGGVLLTYGELEERSNRLARHLIRRGVGPEVRVALALPRSPEMLVALLGILKAGGAYVPVDPFYPAERQRLILEDSRAAVLVTRGDAGEAPSGLHVVRLDRERDAVDRESGEPLGDGVPPEGLAYVLYTSGSTGRPKGVLVPHSALTSYLRWCARVYLNGRPGDALVHSPLGFDLTVTSLLAPLTTGGRVVLLPEENAVEALAAAFAADREWDLVKLTPAHLEALEDLLASRPGPLRVQALIVGGEALRGESLAFWAGRSPDTRVVNEYGPTEATVGCCTFELPARSAQAGPLPIGRPIAGARLQLLSPRLQPVPAGVPGELFVGGAGLARGYLDRPDATAAAFVPDPSAEGEPGARCYRTGDLARWRPDGQLEFLGRADRQVKIRGFRIEPGEIEAVLARHPGVREAVVQVCRERPGDLRLVAYVVFAPDAVPDLGDVAWLARRTLPEPMVPSAWVKLERLPLNAHGKVDRPALPAPPRPEAAAHEPARTGLEREIAAIWQEVLGLETVGLRDNFFDLGGYSLLLARVGRRLWERTGRKVALVDLFRYPTVAALAGFLGAGEPAAGPAAQSAERAAGGMDREIAIIGISGRFPGAGDVDELWRNLRGGVESITFFSEEELLQAGASADQLARPGYVRANGRLQGVEDFDAPFFGFTPREAEITDPQQRIFLEHAWEALENAGYAPDTFPGRIALYAGASNGTYWRNLVSHPDLMESLSGMQIALANDRDYLATRVSYKLDLHGPSVHVQTACSTSLVAVHLACRGLRAGEVDLALAGGVAVRLPQEAGYLYQEGGITSPDGHCRAFDASAGGTVGGNGAGVVVLKRLPEALADGDTIHAVIKGSAVNNDGSRKVGYTAPSLDGQAAVLRDALADAGVDPASVSYIEAHGTATALGDPIEVAALREAYGSASWNGARCALGSVKTNLGHLDAAAGVAGLIKTVLALRHREIPPSLHFREPNPELGLADGPFYVSAGLSEWPAREGPRRAGVSSFGIGGTNVHLVLEEAPPPQAPAPSRALQLLTLSARTPSALDAATARLAAFLEREDGDSLADVAWTLQVGRKGFEHRRFAVCGSREEAVGALAHGFTGTAGAVPPEIVFLFSGQGSQYSGMGRELYRTEALFREQVDLCAGILKPHLGLDLRRLFSPEPDPAPIDVDQTLIAQPALFVLEYALARLWMSWGILPAAMAGHSVGEYVAACLAEVFSLEEALALIAERGRLLQALPAGAMLSVALPEEEVLPLLGEDLSLAAVNGPGTCVVSGPFEAVAVVEEDLAGRGVHCRRLPTSHAFHSQMVEPAVPAFLAALGRIELRPPTLPFLSNRTGSWIRAEEAMDPGYWTGHLRQPVRFSENLRELLRTPGRVLLEIGPGETLATLARRHPDGGARTVAASLPGAGRKGSETASLLAALGRLWLAGARIDWPRLHAGERRRRVVLPTYPFERRRHWVDRASEPGAKRSLPHERPGVDGWLYAPAWKRGAPLVALPIELRDGLSPWLVLCDDGGLGEALAARLRQLGQEVATVAPGELDGYGELLRGLRAAGRFPASVVHLWTATCGGEALGFEEAQRRGFESLLLLAQALGEHGTGRPLRLTVVSTGLQPVTGEEEIDSARATLVGPCRVIPCELPGIVCRSVDLGRVSPARRERAVAALLAELAEGGEPMVAHRGGYRWTEGFAPLPGKVEGGPELLRPGGVYLITGGTGGMGLALAGYLVRETGARVALIGRTPLPDRGEWEAWLAQRGAADPVSRKILALRDLEKLGGEVLTLAADVADAEGMREAVARVRERFGVVHGVIHAAGVPPAGMIQLKTLDAARRVLAPKVAGTRVLLDLFPDGELDFLVLCSSLSALIGQSGRADYCAANAFLGAVAHERFASGRTRIVAIDWDTWREAGMAFEETLRLGRDPREAIRVGLSSEEGVEIFRRALRCGLPQVSVSVEDLESVVERSRIRARTEDGAAPAERLSPRAHPRPPLETPYVAPRDDAERTIAGIWAGLLGIEEVGVHDSFFALGGDSVLAIQIIARLHQAGLQVTPKQVFELQTVAELALAAGTGPTLQAEQGAVTGELPLTPIQAWFFEQEQPDPHHWNQSFLLEARERFEPALLQRAVSHVLLHHDALRLRFRATGGRRVQVNDAPGGPVPFIHLDLSGLPEACRRAAVESAAAALQTGLDLEHGPLLRATLFDLGDGRPGRLHLVVHHLAVDAVSWRILFEDLEASYRQLARGEAVQLPPKTTSFRHWALRLAEHAAHLSPEEEAYWSDPRRVVPPLPVDLPGGRNTVASVRTVSRALGSEETLALLHEVPQSSRVQVDDVLLAATFEAFRRWTGERSLLFDLEGHGREPIFEDVDLSRTVGWFTTLYPVLLRSKESGFRPDALLRSVKEQLRAIPGRGLGYGLLRWLSEGAWTLRELPQSEVIFLYLGQLDGSLSSTGSLGPAPESGGPNRSPRGLREHLLEISASVSRGKLRMVWAYSGNLHCGSTIERLADETMSCLETLIAYCRSMPDPGYTPSDFPTARLSQEELDDLLADLENVQ